MFQARLVGQSSLTAAVVVGKDLEGTPGDRVILTREGRSWCELNYPDWLADCPGVIARYAFLCFRRARCHRRAIAHAFKAT